jgi:hypothetical protein
MSSHISAVMPALVAGIHVFSVAMKDVDGRDKPGHDAVARYEQNFF